MRLTTADLVRFVRGQMELANKYQKYIYRGEIAEIAVANYTLHVKFAWLAKGEGLDLPFVTRWVKEDRLYYTVNIEVLMFRDIDTSGDFRLESLMSGDVYWLFPPNGSKLDRAKVEGLVPVSAQRR